MEAEPRPRSAKQALLKILFDQRFRFLVVGVVNTIIGYLWFVFFQWLIQGRFGYVLALVCAHIASVMIAYLLHRRFVFRVSGHWWRDLGRYEIVQLGSFG